MENYTSATLDGFESLRFYSHRLYEFKDEKLVYISFLEYVQSVFKNFQCHVELGLFMLDDESFDFEYQEGLLFHFSRNDILVQYENLLDEHMVSWVIQNRGYSLYNCKNKEGFPGGLILPLIGTSDIQGLLILVFSYTCEQVPHGLLQVLHLAGLQTSLYLENLKNFREIESANDRLEEKVRLRTEELEQEKHVAEQANVLLRSFLTNMSHELRTPLNAIIGFSNLLRTADLETTQLDFVNTINDSGVMLLDLINGILDFSKIEADHIDLEQVDFNLQHAIASVLKVCRSKLKESLVELYMDYSKDTPDCVSGDPVRIRQVVLNLVNNALKFTDKGDIGVLVRTITEDNQSFLEIEVADTGIGIPEEKFDDIFESFTQVDGSTTRKYGGTGLGLAIVKKLVELMGGKIRVESQLDSGSSFFVRLPLREAQYPMIDEKQDNLEILKGKNVVMVDDNPNSLRIIKNICTNLGMNIYFASQKTLEVLEWFKNNPDYAVDLMISDIYMPNLNGFELNKAIRELNPEPLPKFLSISSEAMSQNQEHIKDLGFDAFLPKPIFEHDLVHRIYSLLKDSIPAASEKDEAKSGSANPEDLMILVVEDNPVNVKLISVYLKRWGYQFDVAVNGKQAVDKLSTESFDLCLMDIQMPIMTGLDAAAAIRNELKLTLPIIALSAGSSNEDKERCYVVGMNDYMVKPIDQNRLKEIIERWI